MPFMRRDRGGRGESCSVFYKDQNEQSIKKKSAFIRCLPEKASFLWSNRYEEMSLRSEWPSEHAPSPFPSLPGCFNKRSLFLECSDIMYIWMILLGTFRQHEMVFRYFMCLRMTWLVSHCSSPFWLLSERRARHAHRTRHFRKKATFAFQQ